MQRAVSYLRSSKDRSDVSLDAQRRELQQLASAKGLLIVGEYADAVESAKTEHRPAFQKLLKDLQSPGREWNAIIALDTSRISRRQHFALGFSHECERRGVQLLYSKVPDVDPMTKILVRSMLTAMDEVHSLMSREKGLAGMRENVLQGWRAGGRAPWGYRRAVVQTATMREGKAVTKTRLEVDPLAGPQAQRYLKLRAAGIPRSAAAARAGVRRTSTGLVGTDWQALTYAGHTVWNVHRARQQGGHVGGVKRRPQAEWTVQRATHAALITDEEAEAILRQMQGSVIGKAISEAKAAASTYMLAGLLTTAAGQRWHGCLDQAPAGPVPYYRVGTKRVMAKAVESAVVTRVLADLRSEAFLKALVQQALKLRRVDPQDPVKPLQAEQMRLARDIDRQMELAAMMKDPAPAVRRAEALENQRNQITAQVRELQLSRQAQEAAAALAPDDIRRLLEQLAEQADGLDPAGLKALLGVLVERVELEPDGIAARVHYSISGGLEEPLTGELMAFPRVHVRSAGIRLVRSVDVTRRVRAR